jgi:hypothetical protein
VEEEQKRAVLAEYYNNSSSRRGKLSGVGSLFGVSNPTVRHNASDLPKTQLELHREFYQKAYLEEQKYWNDNKANIEKEIEADKERQKREMTSSVVNFFSMQFGLARKCAWYVVDLHRLIVPLQRRLAVDLRTQRNRLRRRRRRNPDRSYIFCSHRWKRNEINVIMMYI